MKDTTYSLIYDHHIVVLVSQKGKESHQTADEDSNTKKPQSETGSESVPLYELEIEIEPKVSENKSELEQAEHDLIMSSEVAVMC